MLWSLDTHTFTHMPIPIHRYTYHIITKEDKTLLIEHMPSLILAMVSEHTWSKNKEKNTTP